MLLDRLTALSAEIARLRKMIFGATTERFIPEAAVTPAQLQLALDLDAETIAQCRITSATTIEYVRTKIEVIPAKSKAHPGRMKLPEHLRRETILLKPDGDVTGVYYSYGGTELYRIQDGSKTITPVIMPE